MVTMKMEMETSPEEMTECKRVPNQPAGTATSTDIAKKTAVNASGRMLLAKVSMDQPTGQNKKHHLWEKKINMKPKAPLTKCKKSLGPRTFFSNDFGSCFNAFAANKLIFKENYVHQWGIFQENLQPQFNLHTMVQEGF